MTVNEFWTLLRDAQVAESGHGDHNSARLDLIFIKVNQTACLPDDRVIKDGYERSAVFAPGAPCVGVQACDNFGGGWLYVREITPRQFIEALVRVAVLMNERCVRVGCPFVIAKVTEVACSPPLLDARMRPPVPPHESLEAILDQKLLPFATQSNTDTFRQELQLRDVRRVFKRHRGPLQRVFSHYASLQVSR